MIFITAKFMVKSSDAERWPAICASYTQATRDEPGCLWFEWSRSLDDSTEYVLVEAFEDEAAGKHHVESNHFKLAQKLMPLHLVDTPKIVSTVIQETGWSALREFEVPRSE